ncbi:MAG: hypothetical protein KDI81_00835, partial [Xanthomonadales bacterium]|nr:hypothetical protein [Xanthomonadales bacterium]
LLLAIGFVPALVFAWVFEVTPEGIVRDADAVRSRSGAPHDARRMDIGILIVLALAVGFFAVDRFVLRKSPAAVAGGEATQGVAAPENPSGGHDTDGAGTPASRKSIAVLPFTDLSPGHDQEYFSDGMSEEILNALAQIKDLKVAGRTSAFYFKGRNEDLRVIAAALGVANVLEGSVRKQGNKVRITAQLIQASDGFHLWSDSYDGDLENVFELQERIARSITDALRIVLDARQQVRLANEAPLSAQAHQQYLRGRYFWSRRSYRNLLTAEQAFKDAIAADSDYADAWAALAQTYALLYEYSVNDPDSPGRRNTSAEALEAAERALKLDPGSSAALAARAVVRFQYQFDWAAGEADFRAAIASNPSDLTALQWYGEFLLVQRRFAEAAVQLDAALAVDPLAPIIHMAKANSLAFDNRPEAALVEYDEALHLFPTMYVALKGKTFALLELGRLDEAAAVASQLAGGEGQSMRLVIAAMRDAALVDDAVRTILAEGPGGVSGKPRMLMLLGRKQLALQQLEALIAEGDPLDIYLYAIPEFEPLWKETRFQALLGKIGLPHRTPP